MKIKLSKSKWAEIGKKAGWLNKTAGGFGLLSEETADVFEAFVLRNYKTKTAKEILDLIKLDEWLYSAIKSENVDDNLLLEYIEEEIDANEMLNNRRNREDFRP